MLAGALVNAQYITSGDWYYSVTDGEATIEGYTGSGGAVTIPNEVDGIPVIGISAFNLGGTNLNSVTIGSHVASLGSAPFYGCTSLVSINVDSSNSNYESQDGVLYNKERTTLVKYPAAKTNSSFVIPEGVIDIKEGAFARNTNLTSITIPDSVKNLGEWGTFQYCSNLTSITIPSNVTNIPAYAFQSSGLSNIVISHGVKNIDEVAFGQCTNLTSITIPSSVIKIGNHVFWDCASISNIEIPDSVESVGIGAFAGCASLTNVVFGTGVTEIGSGLFSGGVLAQGPLLSSITFKGNAPQVSLNAFNGYNPPLPPFTLYYYLGTSGWGPTFGGRPTTPLVASLTIISDSAKGSVIRFPDGSNFPPGTTVSLNATALAGYLFSSWAGDSISSDNPLVILMNTNKSVTANFVPDDADTDGDGLSNYLEAIVFNTNPNQAETNSPVPGLYLRNEKQAERINGRNDVVASPNNYGLYTTNQIHNFGLSGIVLNRNTNNQLVLNFQVLQSSDLQNWSPYQAYELPITNAPSDKMFLRVQAVGQ